MAGQTLISVIIPTINESAELGRLIDYLKNELAGSDYEILVCDGGSTDDTRRIARSRGARVVESERKSRALQMNLGSQEALGEIFYFLHADSYPPPGFGGLLQKAVAEGSDSGCFQLRFDESRYMLKFYSWFTRFDLDIFRFGDQSLFVTRSLFNSVGGFDQTMIIMEDHEIIHRIRKQRAEFTLINAFVTTSARKYRSNGVFRLQLIFIFLIVLYYAGAGQSTLVHIYRTLVRS